MKMHSYKGHKFQTLQSVNGWEAYIFQGNSVEGKRVNVKMASYKEACQRCKVTIDGKIADGYL